MPLKPLTLSKPDIRRWILAAPLIMTTSEPMRKKSMIKFGRETNWKLPSNLTTIRVFLAWVVLISPSVIYGGLHMLAWNAPFQTKTEQILWRISAPTMMGYGVLICGIELWDNVRQGINYATYFWMALIFCATLLYLLARVYLVVECFLSLFHSQPGLFRQPNWGPYFPHIS